ncbi:protein of unknown function (plasmid) [Paraburkholderia dioscoreae]|uniref:Uncharacterized protein n=1 Tax=Paraburkholderia dioscoreae TaxID=2604047 RepID=A0A5Q4ZIF1_9BURK|nr:protein of unknown function [Paraburkholderia dioscoreae]
MSALHSLARRHRFINPRIITLYYCDFHNAAGLDGLLHKDFKFSTCNT